MRCLAFWVGWGAAGSLPSRSWTVGSCQGAAGLPGCCWRLEGSALLVPVYLPYIPFAELGVEAGHSTSCPQQHPSRARHCLSSTAPHRTPRSHSRESKLRVLRNHPIRWQGSVLRNHPESTQNPPGDPPGTPPENPPGEPQGTPQGTPQGIPQGGPRGIPRGTPRGEPQDG